MEEQGIGVKEAVQIATKVIRDLYSGFELRDLLLEEVERSGEAWLVTIGFQRPSEGTSPIGSLLVGQQRAYKRIRIDAQTGEFLGMEIRQLPSDPPDALPGERSP